MVTAIIVMLGARRMFPKLCMQHICCSAADAWAISRLMRAEA